MVAAQDGYRGGVPGASVVLVQSPSRAAIWLARRPRASLAAAALPHFPHSHSMEPRACAAPATQPQHSARAPRIPGGRQMPPTKRMLTSLFRLLILLARFLVVN